jgi:hypothetical protein
VSGYSNRTAKYSPDGAVIWTNTAYGALAVDVNGNVFVGESIVANSQNYTDYLTTKYSPDGDFALDESVQRADE